VLTGETKIGKTGRTARLRTKIAPTNRSRTLLHPGKSGIDLEDEKAVTRFARRSGTPDKKRLPVQTRRGNNSGKVRKVNNHESHNSGGGDRGAIQWSCGKDAGGEERTRFLGERGEKAKNHPPKSWKDTERSIERALGSNMGSA